MPYAIPTKRRQQSLEICGRALPLQIIAKRTPKVAQFVRRTRLLKGTRAADGYSSGGWQCFYSVDGVSFWIYNSEELHIAVDF